MTDRWLYNAPEIELRFLWLNRDHAVPNPEDLDQGGETWRTRTNLSPSNLNLDYEECLFSSVEDIIAFFRRTGEIANIRQCPHCTSFYDPEGFHVCSYTVDSHEEAWLDTYGSG